MRAKKAEGEGVGMDKGKKAAEQKVIVAGMDGHT